MLHYLGRDQFAHYGKYAGSRSALDPRNLRFANYRNRQAYTAPETRLWQTPVKTWGVGGNNDYGNCVIVTAAHMLLAWRANELDNTTPITDAAIIDLSARMGALNGYNILDRLNYWRKTGMWGDNLWAFVAVTQTEHDEVKEAIDVFGSLDIGLNLPRAWQNATVWDTGSGFNYRPGSWGGHSVPLVGYDRDYLYAISWGEVCPMTWAALDEYCDEAYSTIDSNWLAKGGVTPSGFDLTALYADLQALQ